MYYGIALNGFREGKVGAGCFEARAESSRHDTHETMRETGRESDNLRCKEFCSTTPILKLAIMNVRTYLT